MSDSSKQILTELKEAMGKMANDPDGLAGWLLSNYRLTKIGSAEPTVFYDKPGKSGVNERQLKHADNPIKKFLDRSGAKPQKDLRAIAEELQRQANGENTQYASEEEAEVQEQAMDEESYIPPQSLSKKLLANNSVFIPDVGHTGPITQQDVENMKQVFAQDPQAGDSIPMELQRARLEKLKKQKEALAGGGPFRRGG